MTSSSPIISDAISRPRYRSRPIIRAELVNLGRLAWENATRWENNLNGSQKKTVRIVSKMK